jgi:hypothetical protein
MCGRRTVEGIALCDVKEICEARSRFSLRCLHEHSLPDSPVRLSVNLAIGRRISEALTEGLLGKGYYLSGVWELSLKGSRDPHLVRPIS